jgi:cellulose biosynthesis protein BcsQ
MRMAAPFNITILAKKGGVGKSTTSILLYEVLRQAGRIVVLKDWDAQGTSSKALGFIHGQKPDAMANPEIVIWDTPPSLDHTATATAARSANLALTITTPNPADLWEAEEAVQFVRQRNANAIVRVVFNEFKKATLLGRLVEDSSKQLSVPYLPVILNSRECYKHAVVQGWKALDNAAREEALQFALAVLSLT